jgi:parallel beta-helix repeat protein
VIKDDTISEINDLKLSGVSGKINIVGEQGWIDFEDAGNCTGSGTYLDPFVIQDLIIDGHGSGSGIKITLSRNYFFRIENCTIFNCTYGIELYSTDNGTLYQNDCSYNGYGIYLHCPSMPSSETYGCYNNTIIENIANNGTYGIHLDRICINSKIINNTANNNNMGIMFAGYPYITISGNTINNNGYSGISLWGPGSGSNSEISRNIAIDNRDCGIDIRSFGFNLTGNFMVGSGIVLWYQSIERISQISIDTTNLVNNKPIYYLINKTDISPQNLEDAGQIFLINCRNILVKDIDVSNSSMGICIYNSNNITVLNAVSSNNNYGISFRNTNNSFIINSTLKYNKMGNFFDGSNNTVEGNYIYSNLWTADVLTFDLYSDYNKIINNEIIGCISGIVFKLSSHNLISGNIIRDNIYGIKIMGGSEHNLFYENFFIGNVEHIYGGSTTNKWNNTEIGNYWDNYTGIDADYNGIGDTLSSYC